MGVSAMSGDGKQANGASPSDVPLPAELRALVGRVAEVWINDELDGYLFVESDVWVDIAGPFWRRRRSAPTERVEWKLVRIYQGRTIEFLDDVCRHEGEAAEMVSGTFTLRGVKGHLVWLDGEAAALARQRYLEE